jgi:ABC-2 type transport system permease protein
MGWILLTIVPLSALLSIGWSIIVSSRATDVRAAQLQSMLIVIPFFIIYVMTEIGTITLDIRTIGIIAGVILVADIILFFLSTKTFQREEILTKWT